MTPPTRESICGCLDRAGFDIEQVTEFTYRREADGERDWLSMDLGTADPSAGARVDRVAGWRGGSADDQADGRAGYEAEDVGEVGHIAAAGGGVAR